MNLVQTEAKRQLAERKMNGSVVNPAALQVHQATGGPTTKVQKKRSVALWLWIASWIDTTTGSDTKPLLMTQSIAAVLRRLGVFWLRLPFRAMSFGRFLMSRKCDTETAEAKNAACGPCPSSYTYVRLNGKVSRHCSLCDCPPSRFSTIENRNSRDIRLCPIGKHGAPSDKRAEAMRILKYDEHSIVSLLVAADCPSGGCGKATR